MAKRPPIWSADELAAIKDGLSFDAATARLVRLYLERVACALERRGNPRSTTYMYAFKIAARAVRALKPD